MLPISGSRRKIQENRAGYLNSNACLVFGRYTVRISAGELLIPRLAFKYFQVTGRITPPVRSPSMSEESLNKCLSFV
jgi:hypothetical protein